MHLNIRLIIYVMTILQDITNLLLYTRNALWILILMYIYLHWNSAFQYQN